MSKHALRKKRVREKISKLEQKALAPADWTMMGETTSKKRPQDALLAEDLEFEHAMAPAPVVTAETTEAIEAIIRQRIADRAFDDVQRKKELQGEEARAPRKLMEVEYGTKTKKSLGDEYAEDYLKAAGLWRDVDVERASKEEVAMQELFHELCQDLDALANFNQTPKPFTADLGITTEKTPAIAVEEVMPMGMSRAGAKTAREVYDLKKSKDSLVGETEVSREDRNAKRNRNKRASADERARRAAAGIVDTSDAAIAKALKADSRVTFAQSSSGADPGGPNFARSATLFNALQSEVRGEIDDYKKSKGISGKGGRGGGKNKKKKNASAASARYKM